MYRNWQRNRASAGAFYHSRLFSQFLWRFYSIHFMRSLYSLVLFAWITHTHTRKRLSTKYLDDFFLFTNCKTLIVLETSIESFMIKVFMIWISNHFFISVLVLFKTRRFHTKKRTIKFFQIYHSKKKMFVTSKCTIISMALTLTNKSTRLFCRRSQKRLRIAAFWCFIGANKFLIII